MSQTPNNNNQPPNNVALSFNGSMLPHYVMIEGPVPPGREPSSFQGCHYGEPSRSWINYYNLYSRAMHWSDQRKVEVFPLYFKNVKWYERAVATKIIHDNTTWAELEALFIAEFCNRR